MVNTTSRPLYPERVVTHGTGGWVDSTARLDGCRKSHSVIHSGCLWKGQETLGDTCAVFPSYRLAHLTPRPQQANKLATAELLTTWRFKYRFILRSSLLLLPAHMLWVRTSIWPISFSRQSPLPEIYSVYSVFRQRQCGLTSSFKFQYPHFSLRLSSLLLAVNGVAWYFLYKHHRPPPPYRNPNVDVVYLRAVFVSTATWWSYCTSHCYSLP